jgi:hypothetical protein
MQQQQQQQQQQRSRQQVDDLSLSDLAGATARFEAERQMLKQQQNVSLNDAGPPAPQQRQADLPAARQHSAQMPQMQQSLYNHLQPSQNFFTAPSEQAWDYNSAGSTGNGQPLGAGPFGGGMFAGAGGFPGLFGGPFGTPFGAQFGAAQNSMGSHANPAIPPVLDPLGGSASAVGGNAGSLGAFRGGPGTAAGGALTGGIPIHVANSFSGLSLESSDDKGSGVASPDTSTEFEFDVAMQSGAVAHRHGSSHPMRGAPGPRPNAQAPALSQPAPQAGTGPQEVVDPIASLKEM